MKIISCLSYKSIDSSAVEALVAACEGRDESIRIEKECSLNAYHDMRPFYSAYEEKRLIGILTIFAPLRNQAEINAVVSPDFRRKRVFSSLLAEAEQELNKFLYKEEMFVVDSSSFVGKIVANRLKADHAFTEYSMKYVGMAVNIPIGNLKISRIDMNHIEALVTLRAGEFGDTKEEAEAFERTTLASSDKQVYAAFIENRMSAVCTVIFQDRKALLTGLVTEKTLRGHGYGQAFLAGIVHMLEKQGFEMTLEVNSRNENAYHIYKKLGFVEEAAVEYYRRDRMKGNE